MHTIYLLSGSGWISCCLSILGLKPAADLIPISTLLLVTLNSLQIQMQEMLVDCYPSILLHTWHNKVGADTSCVYMCVGFFFVGVPFNCVFACI